MPSRIMKRVLLLGIVLAGLLAGAAQAKIVTLRATSYVQTWRSDREFSRYVLLKTWVTAEHHNLTTIPTPRCRTEWTGRGLAVQVDTCGSGPVEVRFVSFDGNKRLRFGFKVVG